MLTFACLVWYFSIKIMILNGSSIISENFSVKFEKNDWQILTEIAYLCNLMLISVLYTNQHECTACFFHAFLSYTSSRTSYISSRVSSIPSRDPGESPLHAFYRPISGIAVLPWQSWRNRPILLRRLMFFSIIFLLPCFYQQTFFLKGKISCLKKGRG